jgi:DNA-binding IclR family transcriptional regulator
MGTTAKALSLLDLFTRARPEIGLSDLARLAGVNKATCFRLMRDLAAAGLVEQVTGSRAYRIGPAVLRLAALREAQVPTREAAMPVLRALAAETGETAHLSILVAGRLETLAFAYAAQHGVRVMMEDADTLPFHATASGHAVLAFLPEAEREAILARPLPRLTPATPTDPAAIRAALAGVRVHGFATAAGSFEADVHGTAVPLFGAGGVCVGALAVAAPAPRLTADRQSAIAAALGRAGAEITALWGGSVPPGLARPGRAAA